MEELRQRIIQIKAVNDNQNPIWREAFDAYNKAFGVNLSMKCSKCFKKIKQWLQL